MYNNIINPETGKTVSIYGKIGKRVIQRYIGFLNGGGDKDTYPIFSMYGADYCGWCKEARPHFDNLKNAITNKESGYESLNGKVHIEYKESESSDSEHRIRLLKLGFNSFPTFLLEKDEDTVIHFPQNGDRKEGAFVNFLKESLSIKDKPLIKEPQNTRELKRKKTKTKKTKTKKTKTKTKRLI